MNTLIENTLHIISKISLSNKGYLLQMNEQSYKVLKNWGCKLEEFELLNDVLYNLYTTLGIDTDNVTSLPAVQKIIKKNSAPNLFIKEILRYSERNLVIYLLLFFENEVQFNDECKDKIVSILSILSHQVKNWISQRVENMEISTILQTGPHLKTNLFDDWLKSFNLVIETFTDVIIVLHNSGKILSVNKTGQELLGYSFEEFREKNLFDLIDPEDLAAVNTAMSQVLINNTPIICRGRLFSKYEKVMMFEITFRKITCNDEVLGMLVIGRDLSEQWKYESELRSLKPQLIETNRLLNLERARIKPQKDLMEELNRMKYEFISNISHEFRTTLASIVGFSEIIESDPDLSEEIKMEFNHVITNEGKRLAKLINDVLDTPKMEEGKIIINKSTFDLLKLVQEVADANNENMERKKITFTLELPSEEVLIEADRENFHRVINALLSNAIKFTGEFGRIKLIVNNLITEVEIVLSDTGIGIPESDLPYIFQQFYRVKNVQNELPDIGVGLVFVKQIVDLHKGLITVQSEIGSGTTFVVKLPKIGKNE